MKGKFKIGDVVVLDESKIDPNCCMECCKDMDYSTTPKMFTIASFDPYYPVAFPSGNRDGAFLKHLRFATKLEKALK